LAPLAVRHTAYGVVRSAAPLKSSPGVQPILADIARPLDSAVLPNRVDAIVHLAQANATFPEQAAELFAVNTTSTQQLLDYGRRAGCRHFLLASTGSVYGRHLGRCRESEPAVPDSFYAVSKYAAELLVGAYTAYFPSCILRLYYP